MNIYEATVKAIKDGKRIRHSGIIITPTNTSGCCLVEVEGLKKPPAGGDSRKQET
ncbi:hypothetical protein [Beduinella massiliensis]|uniref:hypothetical protein n=1 Tax=Beduinella massiliensis TaxID=1852363 RepID=UPI0031F7A044